MRTIKRRTLRLFREIAKLAAPPPQLKVSEWADEYRKLSPEASAEPGQWRTDRAPFQREIMNAVNDAGIEWVIVMSSAQVGKTEIILNTIGYFVDYDPAPMMLIQPTEGMAEAFSKDRLAPMIRDTPALSGKIRDVKSRGSDNTILHKKFPGGHVTLGGANAPATLASRPIRVVLCDEVDRYPASAGTEGDPVSLVSKRTTTFWNRKIILVSTPTIKGASRIESAYEDSTMERWQLPCPSCGQYQPLTWGQIHFADATHACSQCGALHGEFEWKAGTGKWVARKDHAKIRGFHLNELASPWKRWSEIIEDFRKAKKDGLESLKVWVNTALGETWEEEGESLAEDKLFERLEEYPHAVPDEVKLLTAAVDVQDDRFEIEVVGWGAGKESWGIEYHVIRGDLKLPQVWNELREYLSRSWTKGNQMKYSITCTCMDSGGHFTTDVYRFCAKLENRRVYAIKGQGAQNGEYVPFLNGHMRTKREKAILFSLGVDEGKSKVFSRLQAADPGPNYCHFPKEKGYNQDYFKGLTAEKQVTRYREGIPYKVWKKVRERNEPLDLRVYNTAALEILNPKLEEIDTGQKGQSPMLRGNAKSGRRVLSKGI
ncbi:MULTISPECIES: phage terminase large subunit family protein [Paenibacillus]|uniref:phage terminase large subunit family protein n=1 Tax=Paenibacillus TaxID=44249 RepID=UPI0022B89B91|nr:phage terminase large subunit family protein [Paenibacillus caseinilyticus]MCZ8520139.1 phage terminase large subunit family protein [Paenibacillus caseinilyticus]